MSLPKDQQSPYPGGDTTSPAAPTDRDRITQRLPRTKYGDTDDEAEARYLDSIQVRRRYGNRSDMWLWRRLRDDPSFPKPIEIGRRRFWRLDELVVWEHAHQRGAA
jgi:predicted DNA-binding transcriptional regulator AlpA